MGECGQGPGYQREEALVSFLKEQDSAKGKGSGERTFSQNLDSTTRLLQNVCVPQCLFCKVEKSFSPCVAVKTK